MHAARLDGRDARPPFARVDWTLRKFFKGQKLRGERGWTRTIDPCLKRALLCQLSYAPTFFQFNIGEGVCRTLAAAAPNHGAASLLTVMDIKSICVTKLVIPEP